MGRPSKPDKRDQQLNLKLTAREIAWVRARAHAAGMQAVDFGRAQLLAERPMRAKPPAPAHLDPLFIAQLSRIGNNLNQMTRCCHQLEIPPPPALGPLLQTIREIIQKGAAHGS